jgi:hypothetical protein
MLAATAGLQAQTTISAVENPVPPVPTSNSSAVTLVSPMTRVAAPSPAPFSRLAFGGGVSSMGVNLQVAVLANRFIDVRGSGSFFNYSVNNQSIDGLVANGAANFSSARTSVDFYPFPSHGFRVSPGVLFYNHNQVTANVSAPGGTSFTLDGYTYYSSQANPVTGTGSVGLFTQNPAFTITTGWGALNSRRGSHLSFPMEIGAAFIGSPAVNMSLLSGQVCANPQGTVGCVNVVGNSQINSNLQAQVAKVQSDLNPFRYYPIVSAGIAYSFSLRGGSTRVAAR